MFTAQIRSTPVPVRPRGLIAAAGLLACLAATAPGQIKFLRVGESGDAAPGTAPGVTFNSVDFGFGFPYMNNTRQCAFRAWLTGPGVTSDNDSVMYGGVPGALVLAAREGDAAPGAPAGVSFGTFDAGPFLAGSGAMALRSSLVGAGVVFGVNDSALWGGRPGALALAARTGDAAPGTGSTYASFGVPAINSFNQLAFNGTINDMGERCLWFGAPGSIMLLAGPASVPPGFGPSHRYGSFETSTLRPTVRLNSAGQVAFFGEVVGPGIGAANNMCLWGGTPGSLHLIVREGVDHPALPSGVHFATFQDPVLTDSGAVAFNAFLRGTGVTAANDFGIWRGFILGVLSKVAREGDGAPGTTGVFSNISGLGGFGVARMNNANQVAFLAQISGPGVTAANDTGVWAHNDGGALVLVAREGNPAPGESTGVVFTGFNPESPVINGRGQVAFMASITGGFDGIWATDPYGAMHRVVREWVPFELAPGTSRTPTAIRPITGRGVQDGTPTSFTDDGMIFFRTDFVGGVGLYVADVNDQCKPFFTDMPDDVTGAPGDDVSFAVTTTGPGVHAYQWRRDGVDLFDGAAPGHGFITGATTPTLSIFSVTAADAGAYDCVVTNRCRAVVSDAAMLSFCPADFNRDGSVDFFDYLDFVAAYDAEDPGADFNRDGSIDFFDYLDFIAAFAAGC